LEIVNPGAAACQIELKTAERRLPVEDKPKSAENQPDPSSLAGRRSRKIVAAGLSGHQDFLMGEVWRGRSLGDKGELEVTYSVD
jgi:hypothetical protein